MSTDHSPDGSRTDSQTDSDAALAAHLDMDLDDPAADLDAVVTQLTDRDIDPVVTTVLETLADTIQQLQNRVAELEAQQERTHDVATTASGTAAENASRLDDVEEEQVKTRDVAKSAIAKAQQLEADADEQEDAEQLPAGVEPSSSPLDFFANCRQQKLKEVFVEQSTRHNTYRAIAVAKRWPEFATERHDGSGVFFTKDDVTDALTAELGKQPHRQTVKRVWSKLQELGSDDCRLKRRQVGRKQEPTEILALDKSTAEGLLEQRYAGLDLLEGGHEKATAGGVTPVVMEAST